MAEANENPLLKAYNQRGFGTRDESVNFPAIKVPHFLPALEKGIELARENYKKIKENSETPTFENTILANETAAELQEMVSTIYFNLFSAEGPDDLQALAKEIAPKNAAFANEVLLDEKLFERVKSVYDQRDRWRLSAEQTMLLEKTYKHFVRNGALLSPADKDKLRKIDQELSVLGPHFSENVLKATNAFELVIDNKNELVGLPESALEAAAAEAEQKNKKGKWLFTLQAPSYIPLLQYADNRELRKKIWFAAGSRCFKDAFDNQDIILKTVRLKNERAQLLGFKSHAHFTLDERMAETPETVMQFLNKLLTPSKRAATKDIEELKAFKKTLDDSDDLMPWDVAYYSEKLKEKKFHFNEEDLRPFFKLENVVQGVFEHARRLYGLKFKKVTDVPVYHPDVEVFEVREESSDQYVGLFYTDFFPRPTKKGGAWMTAFRDQGFYLGQVRRPHVSIVCNFTKPTPSKPSLLTYDEVHTLFHEFGHALHGLLSKCQYRSLAGPNVYWDFVELPSQIMENWVREKEGLEIFARHYETQAQLPAELIEKIKAANRFQAGYMSLRQLNFAFLDMSWHNTDPKLIADVDAFEQRATENTRLFPIQPGVNSSCGFSHIFAGGYSAGYYSYKWAEVLDADAFEFFKEKGLFNHEVASSFKDNILSRGGTEHPMELYKRFRGREPDPNALLRRDGLLES